MNQDSQKDIDCQTFVGLIQLILDDEASQAEKQLFSKHEHLCHHCADKYNIERSVIEVIRKKVDKDCCPDGFANLVRKTVINGNEA